MEKFICCCRLIRAWELKNVPVDILVQLSRHRRLGVARRVMLNKWLYGVC